MTGHNHPHIRKLLDEVRAAIARCPLPERDVLEALVEEAEGWRMRLEELEAEEEGEEC